MSNDLHNLEDKIRQFQAKTAEGPNKEAQAERDAKNMNAGIRAGTELVVSIGAGTLIGWGLDSWLGTKPLFLIVFILAGIGAGFMNIYRITQNMGGSVGYGSLQNQKKPDKKSPEIDN